MLQEKTSKWLEEQLQNSETMKKKGYDGKIDEISLNPKKLIKNFTRFSNDMIEVLYHPDNLKVMGINGISLFLYIMRNTIGYSVNHTFSMYWKPVEIQKKTGINEKTLHKVKSKLEWMNIIKIEDTPKEWKTKEKGKNSIFTKKMVTLNPFTDTWNVPEMDISNEYIEENEVDDKEQSEEDNLKDLLDKL